MDKKRIIYMDYLRVFAIMAVITLHIASQYWSVGDGRSLEWQAYNFYDSIVRWGVPVFVMISGVLFLGRDIDTKTLYKKYICRLVIAYGAWAVFYAFAVPLGKYIVNKEWSASIEDIISSIISGAFHMWFIPMIIGLYMFVPIIKQIIKSESVARYFLLITFVFTLAAPQLLNICNDFLGIGSLTVVGSISRLVLGMRIGMIPGYAFYFVLGYYLNNITLTKKQCTVIYILGAVGFVSTITLSAAATWISGAPCGTYYNNLSVNVALEAMAVFVLFKNVCLENDKLNTTISKLSKLSFGAYLVHIFVIDVIRVFGVTDLLKILPFITVPVLSVVVMTTSFVASFLISKVPIVNKWIV